MRAELNERGRSILLGVTLAAIAIVFQKFGIEMVEDGSGKAGFEKIKNKNEWVSDISSLEVGTYYVSIGRPRGNCDLLVDGQEIASNRSVFSKFRTGLMLGAPLEILPNVKRSTVVVRCAEFEGFSVNLTNRPLILSYRSGMLLQLFRCFLILLFAPLCAVWLLGVTLIGESYSRLIRRFGGSGDENPGNDLSNHSISSYATFAFVGLLYSVSLAHFPRLFMSEADAYTAHVFLRHAFSLAYLAILFRYIGHARLYQLSMLISVCVTAAVYVFDIKSVHPVYQYQYGLFVVTSVVSLVSLFRIPTVSSGMQILRGIAVAWTLSQVADFVSLWSSLGAYNAPMMVGFIVIAFSNLRREENASTLRRSMNISKILRFARSNASLKDTLAHIAAVTSDESRMLRASAYIDQYGLGIGSEPMRRLERVMEFGYKKDTSKDRVIDTKDGRGLVMIEAMRAGVPILRVGREGAWYLVVPIGKHAFINLSDDRARSSHLAYETLAAMNSIKPALDSVESRLQHASVQSRFAINILRERRGPGSWEETIGSVFLDVSQYSKLSEIYGNAFTKFFSNNYLPALIKAASDHLTIEFTRGDEVYFCVTKDLLKDESINMAVIRGIKRIFRFVSNEGRDLCALEGFSAIRARVGANVGKATLVVNDLEVKTLGHTVNIAKRLQEEATDIRPLVCVELAADASSEGFAIGESVIVLVKENKVTAKPIYILDEVKEAS